ncbi:hypothetical protein EJ04DRAFT_535706 [Polyplosphaeria fusca]|uniref:Uncharacterized protein n=1 Tax=Polyplosphaeria fusca TaxID=682080 RepID=A0A9P4QY77_9PLEO|nr:hypothetical protein EJ04DRAFT_535706 [Polyplosphaeria fusca]
MDPASQTNTVLLLDLPPSALGGIDLLSFTTTPRFKGVKNLPPGLHFVFASSEAGLAVRHGAWFYVSPGSTPQIFIKKWDPATEELVPETEQPEVMRWRANLGSMWKGGLTPYRQTVKSEETAEDDTAVEESTDWTRLTSRIGSTLLSRITGLNTDHWSLSSASSAAEDLEYIPGLDQGNSVKFPEKELQFLPIDLKRTWRIGATGQERTEAALDRTWALGDIIDNHCHGQDTRTRELEVLGELQFAFLMVLTLNNNSCLEQWKRLLGVLLTCQEAVKQRTHLFIELLLILKLQLSHCMDTETGLFDISEEDGGFLRPLLRRFRKGLDDHDGKWKFDVVEAFDELQDFLRDNFGWELDDAFVKRGMLQLEDGEQVEMDVGGLDMDEERGEYAPTIVELTPSQMKELGLDGSRDDSATDGDTGEDEETADLDEMDTRY